MPAVFAVYFRIFPVGRRAIKFFGLSPVPAPDKLVPGESVHFGYFSGGGIENYIGGLLGDWLPVSEK